MRIHVRTGAAMAYVHRCYRHAHPQCGMLHKPEWVETLKKIENTWVEVETDHLFSDQFNTVPIPGVSEQGLRLMIEDVTEIEDDVRIGVVKCSYCFGYDYNHDGFCDNPLYGSPDYLHPLNPITREKV